MKTKISQKNKNIINIKINTEKKKKNNRQKRAKAGSPKGRSSYNSGYSVTPPIIINQAAPPVFPQYNRLPEPINNITREPEKINNTPEPVMVKQEEPAVVRKEPVNMITERLVKFNYLVKPSSKKQFINDTSTSPAPLAENISNNVVIPSMNSVNDNFNKPVMVSSETSMEKPEMKDAGTFVRRGKHNKLYDDTPVKGRPNRERQHRRMEAEGIVTPSRLRYREESDDGDDDDSFEIKSPFHQI